MAWDSFAASFLLRQWQAWKKDAGKDSEDVMNRSGDNWVKRLNYHAAEVGLRHLAMIKTNVSVS